MQQNSHQWTFESVINDSGHCSALKSSTIPHCLQNKFQIEWPGIQCPLWSGFQFTFCLFILFFFTPTKINWLLFSDLSHLHALWIFTSQYACLFRHPASNHTSLWPSSFFFDYSNITFLRKVYMLSIKGSLISTLVCTPISTFPRL